jgi:hypothetical protein
VFSLGVRDAVSVSCSADPLKLDIVAEIPPRICAHAVATKASAAECKAKLDAHDLVSGCDGQDGIPEAVVDDIILAEVPDESMLASVSADVVHVVSHDACSAAPVPVVSLCVSDAVPVSCSADPLKLDINAAQGVVSDIASDSSCASEVQPVSAKAEVFMRMGAAPDLVGSTSEVEAKATLSRKVDSGVSSSSNIDADAVPEMNSRAKEFLLAFRMYVDWINGKKADIEQLGRSRLISFEDSNRRMDGLWGLFADGIQQLGDLANFQATWALECTDWADMRLVFAASFLRSLPITANRGFFASKWHQGITYDWSRQSFAELWLSRDILMDDCGRMESIDDV